MRAAHHPSSQSHRCHRGLATASLLALAGCASEALPPSVWPPADFEFHAEQIGLGLDGVQVQRRLRVYADGVVVYGAASESLRRRIEATPGVTVALPVFDRLSVYRLVPDSLRAFGRRLERLGVATMPTRQGESGEPECDVVLLRWRAFGRQNRILVQGSVGGPIAELLAVVAAHLPAGERFELPGQAPRHVAPVLRSVPRPLEDRAGALRAHAALCEQHADAELLLDTFALACASGNRAEAERWLARYGALPEPAAEAAAETPAPRLDERFLRQFMPQ